MDDPGRETSGIHQLPGEHLGHLGHVHGELGGRDPGQLAGDMVSLDLDRRLATAEQDQPQPMERVVENHLEILPELSDLARGKVVEHHDPRAASAQGRPEQRQRVQPTALVGTDVRDGHDLSLAGLDQTVAQERPEEIRVGTRAGHVEPDQPSGKLGSCGPARDRLGLAPPGRGSDHCQQS